MSPTTVANLTLTILAHPCDAVLTMDVGIWSKVCIFGGGKIYLHNNIGKLQVIDFTPPLGFLSETSFACVSWEKGDP